MTSVPVMVMVLPSSDTTFVEVSPTFPCLFLMRTSDKAERKQQAAS